MRLHRLIAILLLIESRGHITAKELALALETSIRTIYRDIDTLCESGIPLIAATGPNGGFYLIEGYHIDMNHLYADDVINLYLCGIGIRPEGQTDAGLKLQNTLLKLEKSLPSEYSSDIKKARERFYYDEIPWWGKRVDVPFLEIIRKSVWQSKMLEIWYGKNERKNNKRKVHPYGMIIKNMEWYLVAYCEYSEEARTFKCERINGVELLDESFKIPDNFSLKQYWKKSEDAFKRNRNDAERYYVSIKIHKYNRDILDKLEIYETHVDNDYIIAVVNMHKYEFACHEAMDIVGKAEIMEPLELRLYIKERLKTIILDYSNSLPSLAWSKHPTTPKSK